MALADVLRTFQEEKVVVRENGKYVEKDSGGVSLKGVLQRGRLKLAKDKYVRPQGVSFRPSGITFGYCRRLKVAQLAGLVQIHDKKATPKQQFVFDMGHAIHDILQGYFWDLGILKGSFKCTKCDKVFHGLTSPTQCPSGIQSHTRKFLQYREVIMRDEVHLINGRCDGILVIDDEEHLMDIKSIQNKTLKTVDKQFCFEDLEDGPKEEHIIQLMLYMWMSGIHRGHLVYVGKNNHQIKTFAIPYNFLLIAPYLREIEYLMDAAKKLKAKEPVELPEPCGREDCLCHDILSIRPK